MADTPYPLEHPLGKPAVDYKTLNMAGVGTDPRTTNAFINVNEGVEDQARALEQRFERPNWLKVSAAFAKPQLGGFGASFGTAMDELGKQEEAYRAVAPTVARMRAEVAAGKLPMSQGLTQQEAFKRFQANPTPEAGIEVLNFGKDTSAGKAVLEYFPTLNTIAGTKSTLQSNSSREQELMKSDPYYIPLDKDLQKDWNTLSADRNQAFKKGLLDSGLFNQDQINNLTSGQLQANYASVTKQQAEKRLTDSNESGNVLSSSMNTLSQLSTSRELAKSKDMEKLLGIGAGQTAVSALFGFIAQPNDPNSYSRLSAAAQKLAKDDPDLYSKFVVLQKGLNTNVADARELITTPSNQATSLVQSTYPNVLMPQKAIVNLIDLMAAKTMRDARIAAARQSPAYRDFDPNRFQSSDAFKGINDDMDSVKKDIINNKYFGEKAPHKLYYAGSIFEGVQPVAAPNTSANTNQTNAGTNQVPARRIRSARDLIDEATR